MFLSPFNVLIRWSAIFGLALASAALLGVGWQDGFSSHIFPDVSITVGYLPYWGILVFKCVIQHLGYLLSLASQPCLICTVSQGLHSILGGPFNCSMSPTFSEGVLKWSGETCGGFRMRWISWYTNILSDLSALVFGGFGSLNRDVLTVV